MKLQPVASDAVARPNKSYTSISACPDSFAKWYCLNGATCFSVKIQESTLYNCWCPVGYHGLRCDYKYIGANRQQVVAGNKASDTSQLASISLSDIEAGQNSVRGQNQEEQQAREIYYLVSVYMPAVSLLVIILVVLIFQIFRKKQPFTSSVGHLERRNRAGTNANNSCSYANMDNGQISHDRERVSVELACAFKWKLEERLKLERNQSN